MRIALMLGAVFAMACGIEAGGYVPAPDGTVCASGLVYQGTFGSPSMTPGLACRSCHRGENFEGQNPRGLQSKANAYFFMGTAYALPNEADRCLSAAVPAGAKVDILDNTGAVKLTLLINSAGNFFSQALNPILTLPYTARVVANGKIVAMSTPQTDGNCNACHTQAGREGAAGRITWAP